MRFWNGREYDKEKRMWGEYTKLNYLHWTCYCKTSFQMTTALQSIYNSKYNGFTLFINNLPIIRTTTKF